MPLPNRNSAATANPAMSSASYRPASLIRMRRGGATKWPAKWHAAAHNCACAGAAAAQPCGCARAAGARATLNALPSPFVSVLSVVAFVALPAPLRVVYVLQHRGAARAVLASAVDPDSHDELTRRGEERVGEGQAAA